MNQLVKKEKCQTHTSYDIQFACLTLGQETCLKCQVCMLKDQMKHYFISIPEAASQDLTKPIQNWPPGIDDTILEFLSQNSELNKKEEIEGKVLCFYKELQSQILEVLEDALKSSMQFINQCLLGEHDLIEFYNQCFKRRQLQKLFENGHSQLDSEFKNLLHEVNTSKERDLNELTKKIKLYQDIDNLVCFDQSLQIKLVLDSIKSKINFFSPSLIAVQEDQSDLSDQEVVLTESNGGLGGISPTNLNRFKDIKRNMITKIRNLQQSFQQGKKELDEFVQQINLNGEMKSKQTELILNTIEKAQQHISEYKHELVEERQQINHCNGNQKKNGSQNGVEKQSNIPTEQHNTFHCVQFIQSAYSQQKKIKIGKDKKQNLVVQCPNLGYTSATVYSNSTLLKDKAYVLRFTFDQPFYSYYNICIGLIDSNKINNWIGDSNQRMLNGDTDGSFSKLQKGNFIGNSSNKEDIKTIEMRVCIDKGIIQYSDYPNYDNVIQNKEEINKSIDYRICIGFCWTYSAIVTLTHFEILDDFIPFS